MCNCQSCVRPLNRNERLEAFLNQHNITKEQLDGIMKQCDHYELNALDEGNFKERQLIINKYL